MKGGHSKSATAALRNIAIAQMHSTTDVDRFVAVSHVPILSSPSCSTVAGGWLSV
jgi:hypothetical protein